MPNLHHRTHRAALNDVSDELALSMSTPPALRPRLLCSVAVALVAILIISGQYGNDPAFHTDFGVSWFGARSIIHGIDPYPLVGKGKPFEYAWPLVYPGTALVTLLPLGFLAERPAAMIFVGLSTFLLTLGLTRRGWYLLPLFATEAFMNSVRLGQWSIVLTAALFFPWLGVLSVVKPQASLPILAGTKNRATWIYAVLGGLSLLIVSVLLLPGWPREWWLLASSLQNVDPPITRFGGFLVLAVLLKWRRPESWLVLVLACLPQTPAWYGALPLFTIPGNFIEAVAMAGVAAVGGNLGAIFFEGADSAGELARFMGGLQVLTIYLPAVWLILRRPNEGNLPAWQAWAEAKNTAT